MAGTKKGPRPGGITNPKSFPMRAASVGEISDVGKLERHGATTTGYKAPHDPREGLPNVRVWRS